MKKKIPLVSVVIPCYNHEQFVQDSIKSVIDQDYENIELIIIDDGSTDNSIVKIQELFEICKRRFTRFEFISRSNKGLSATLNEALEWCEGEYYSAIASDDQMLNDKTTIQLSFLEKNAEFAAVFGGVQLIDENDINLDTWLKEDRSYNFEDIIMHKHELLAPTQMIRLSAIKKAGGYNPKLFIEDWYMWLKLSENSKIYYISKVFSLYRQHDNNSSKKFYEMHQGRIEVLECFKDHSSYKKAIKNAKWINALESFKSYHAANRKIEYFLYLFLVSPKNTIQLVLKKIKREVGSKINL